MARNVRSYDHFCVVARSLERIGDRWSLLVVRDLLSGPKRFTDLMDRLGGITPKTLTQRLRELDEVGIVETDREPGRRQVWYQLSPAGRELAPAIEALAWWGWRNAWRPPRTGEPLHAEHLLSALKLVLNHECDDSQPARWLLRFAGDGEYTMENGGQGWSLTSAPSGDAPDVTVVATTTGWLDFIRDPTPERAEASGIEIAGASAEVRRFHRLLRTFTESAAHR